MSIVKEAFKEGRETTVKWKDSRAKQADVKMRVAIANIESFSKREKLSGTPIPIARLCPTTGKVLQKYPNRLSAAQWVVENVCNDPDKNPLSVTGNMEMCMRAGWKSYGFYWKILDGVGSFRSYKAVLVKTAKGKKKIFSTIKKASEYMGISRHTLGENLMKYGHYKNNKGKAVYND